MIPLRFITAWQQYVPWKSSFQVEQDLLISRALIEIYQMPLIQDNFAFRGGTALNKLFINPPARYSEDIDLVQLTAGPIGEAINSIQDSLNIWLGEPKVKRWHGRVTLIYYFESEAEPKLPGKLKIEINTQEHFSCLKPIHKTFTVDSKWFTGSSEILTYELDELAATKLRALYQRKKGRDLFDMDLLLKTDRLNLPNVINFFEQYLKQENNQITRALFEKNLFEKISSTMFLRDMEPLLAAEQQWNAIEAYENVMANCVALLKGSPWKNLKLMPK